MANKLPKGSKLSVVKTQGLEKGNYDLFDIRGLTLGKLHMIRSLLEQNEGSSLSEEIIQAIDRLGNPIDQTIDGK